MNELSDLRAKNEAAYELLVEFLTNARSSNRLETIRKFLNHLLMECRRKGAQALDLNEVFHFILFGSVSS